VFARHKTALHGYQALLWSACAAIIAIVLIIAYARNDQIYPVVPLPNPGYSLFLEHSDLKSTLPVGTYTHDINNGLRIYSNTYWCYEMNFPRSASVPVHITAKGSPVQGVYPLVALTLDYEPAVLVNIDSPDWKTFEATLPVSAGTHILTVAFINDAFQYPEDRNLDIRSLCIGAPQAFGPPDKMHSTTHE
jgi:hypothetical protein